MTFWNRKPNENHFDKKPLSDWEIDWNLEGGKERWNDNEVKQGHTT